MTDIGDIPGSQIPNADIPGSQIGSATSGQTSGTTYPTWLQLPLKVENGSTTYYKQNDTAPWRCVFLTDAAGRPIDLTGATVTYRLQIGGELVVDAAGVVLAALAGMAGYVWQTGNLAIVGTYEEEWEVALNGNIMHVPTDGFAFLVVSPALGS